jgi:UDP-N-acetylmuramate dehydrogenase
MNWLHEWADRLEHDVPMAPHTWFRLGGCAKYVFHPRDERDLAEFAARAGHEAVPWRVLGAGANVLVNDDGVDGVVVRLDSPSFRRIERVDDGYEVGGGVDLMPFSRSCSAKGLSGLECMAGIPATVGGALRMNAGGRFGEFGSIVHAAKLLNRDGTIETWTQQRLGFGYRQSAIDDRVVLSTMLYLQPDDPERTRKSFEDNFTYKMKTQPMVDKSAGCIFKNPSGQSAGALIDRAGLKGTCRGGARVSEQHGNFIVANKDARASDVVRLIDFVRHRVRDVFATDLEVEIDIW